MSLKLPLYWSYNRVIQKMFKTVLIIQTVLIIETKEYKTFKGKFMISGKFARNHFLNHIS